MASLRYLRACIERGSLEEVDYCLHPISGNIAVMELLSHPELFWKVFGGLSQAQYQRLGANIFVLLDRLNLSLAYLLKLVRKCQGGASLQILQWIVASIARQICDDLQNDTPKYPHNIVEKTLNCLKKHHVNVSAMSLFQNIIVTIVEPHIVGMDHKKPGTPSPQKPRKRISCKRKSPTRHRKPASQRRRKS